jgi:gliding motility-associated-like protein
LTNVELQVVDEAGCSAEYANVQIVCPTCDDGIQNGNEDGIDCGGPDCEPCDDCFDGIQNGDEEGVDCGGSCTPCQRNLPNVLTPNGDSYNDTWQVTFLLDYPNNNVKIFSRWGSLLYERDGYYDEFDGTIDGEELPKGTYYYLIDTGADGDVMNGTLTILR